MAIGSNCAVSNTWSADLPFSQSETKLPRTQLNKVGSKELCSQLGARPLNMTPRWIKLGVNFEEGGNRSARRKPSKSGWDCPKLIPHTTLVVEVEGVIDVQGVQHRKAIQMVTDPDINPVQQGLTLVNRREPLFSFGADCPRRRVGAVSFRPTNYEQCLHLSEWHICISEFPQETHFYASRIHKFKKMRCSSTLTS